MAVSSRDDTIAQDSYRKDKDKKYFKNLLTQRRTWAKLLEVTQNYSIQTSLLYHFTSKFYDSFWRDSLPYAAPR